MRCAASSNPKPVCKGRLDRSDRFFVVEQHPFKGALANVGAGTFKAYFICEWCYPAQKQSLDKLLAEGRAMEIPYDEAEPFLLVQEAMDR